MIVSPLRYGAARYPGGIGNTRTSPHCPPTRECFAWRNKSAALFSGRTKWHRSHLHYRCQLSFRERVSQVTEGHPAQCPNCTRLIACAKAITKARRIENGLLVPTATNLARLEAPKSRAIRDLVRCTMAIAWDGCNVSPSAEDGALTPHTIMSRDGKVAFGRLFFGCGGEECLESSDKCSLKARSFGRERSGVASLLTVQETCGLR